MTDSTTSAGWTCGKCGVYVNNGEQHICFMDENIPYTPPTWNLSPSPPWEKILELLERIAVSLEGLEKR